MKLPTLRRLIKEDLGGKDVPNWIDKILYVMNLFFDTIYRGLNRGLTLKDNVDCQFYTISIDASVTPEDNKISFQLTTREKPNYLIVLDARLFNSGINTTRGNLTVEWISDGKQITINSIDGLTAAKYTLTFLVLTT